MKILMLAQRFYPHIGGVEKHVLELSKELVRRGFSVTVVTPKYQSDLSDEEEVSGIKILRFSKINIPKVGQLFFLLWLLLNKGKIGHPKIIHGHDFYSKPLRWIFPKTPHFITYHGYEGFPLQERNIRDRQWVNQRVSGSIAIGDFITKWYGIAVDLVSYGAVILPKTIKKQKIVYDGCFVGRLEKDTGIKTYLESVSKIKDMGISFKLVVCGDGSLRRVLENYAAKKNLDVRFVGMVENVGEYLEKSDIAFVSGYLSLLEAMVRRRLVISTYDNPLKNDYLRMIPKSDQIMIIEGNAEGISRAISHIRGSSSTKNMIDRAYDWASKQTWSNLADAYLKLYKKKGVSFG